MKNTFLAAAVCCPHPYVCLLASTCWGRTGRRRNALACQVHAEPGRRPQIDVPMHPEWKTVYDFACPMEATDSGWHADV